MKGDFLYALRVIRKSPGFTALAVTCLALGIGINTAIFSIVNGIILRPFPFDNPDDLVAVISSNTRLGVTEGNVSYEDFEVARDQAKNVTGLAAYSYRSMTLAEGNEPERFLGSTVSWNLFQTLGVQPHIGNLMRQEDDRVGAAGVVILGYEVWTNKFRADSSVIGRTTIVNGSPHTILAVMEPQFEFPEDQKLWIPIAPIEDGNARQNRGLNIVGRVAPGSDIASAVSEVTAVSQQLEAQYPEQNRDWRLNVIPLRERFVDSETSLVMFTMMGAVTFVLLIACANVANLMLSRATARGREIAIRAALGAGRFRLMRQLLTESVVVAVFAGMAGIPLAWVALRLIELGIPPENPLPYYMAWSIDGDTLIYTVVVSVATGLVFGLAPALQGTRADLQGALKEGGRGSGASAGRNRLRSALVVTEMALSLVLLVGAALFVRSFMNLQTKSAGFDTAPLMTMRTYFPGDQYAQSEARVRRMDDIIRRIEALPGVEAATASNTIALGDGGSGGNIVVEGSDAAAGDAPGIFWTGVTTHWFRTLGLRALRGRDFNDAEGLDSSRVAIINKTMADRFWGENQDPIGKRFRFASSQDHWLTIVGVMPDFSLDIDDSEIGPAAFLPYPYLASLNSGITIRTTGNPSAITASVRNAIRASDPALPIFEVSTMERVRAVSMWNYTILGGIFSAFGAIALVLASIGLYGVVSYMVAQRTHEIGVRIALGAQREDVIRMVVRQGLVLALMGVGVGLLGAFGVTRVLQTILYNVSPTDPVSFAGISIFLVATAVLASFVPALKATKVDPMIALRYE